MPAPTAILLPIGNELLSGKTQDTNAAYAANLLTRQGVQVRRILMLPDELELLAREICELKEQADLLITSGGIGATPDDLTRQAVAAAFGLPLERNPVALEMLGPPRAGYASDSRLRMADLPVGCRLIPNPLTRAPGFIVENVYVLPGVPELFRLMFDSILPELPGSPVFFAELTTWRYEGEYAEIMEEAVHRFPGVNIGSYPKLYHAEYACLLTFTGAEEREVTAAREWFATALDALPPRPVHSPIPPA